MKDKILIAVSHPVEGTLGFGIKALN